MPKLTERLAPLAINHLDQFPAATVSFNLADGAFLGDALKVIAAANKPCNGRCRCKPSIKVPRLAFDSSLTNTLWLVLAAIITVYIVLGVLYESYLHPITILSTLPSAG